VVIPATQVVVEEKVIDALDIFIESGYFDTSYFKIMSELANKYQIPWRAHVDELTDGNGAEIASSYGASSCDHLLYTNEIGAKALAKNKTVGVLLPGTAFFLGKKLANAKMLLDHGVKIALASDYNPGSCHFSNLLQIAKMSAMSLKLNNAQLWSSITLNAAHALNLSDRGHISIGGKAHFTFFECNNPMDILYDWDENIKIRTYHCL
jgi:imidazolonepropionase